MLFELAGGAAGGKKNVAGDRRRTTTPAIAGDQLEQLGAAGELLTREK